MGEYQWVEAARGGVIQRKVHNKKWGGGRGELTLPGEGGVWGGRINL